MVSSVRNSFHWYDLQVEFELFFAEACEMFLLSEPLFLRLYISSFLLFPSPTPPTK